MGRLHDEQQDTDWLAAYTHFDCWFWDDDDGDRVHGELHSDFEDDIKVAEMRDQVVKHWDEVLGTHIYDYLYDMSNTVRGIQIGLNDEHYWNAVIMYLLRAGYDVFEGSTFIEIYAEDDYVAV